MTVKNQPGVEDQWTLIRKELIEAEKKQVPTKMQSDKQKKEGKIKLDKKEKHEKQRGRNTDVGRGTWK